MENNKSICNQDTFASRASNHHMKESKSSMTAISSTDAKLEKKIKPILKERSTKRRRSGVSNPTSSIPISHSDHNDSITDHVDGKCKVESKSMNSSSNNNKIDKIVPLLPLPPPPCVFIPQLLEQQLEITGKGKASSDPYRSRKRGRDQDQEENDNGLICSNCVSYKNKMEQEIAEYQHKVEKLEEELKAVKQERKMFAEAIAMLVGGRNELDKYVSMKDSQSNKTETRLVANEMQNDPKSNNAFDENVSNSKLHLIPEMTTLKRCIEMSKDQ